MKKITCRNIIIKIKMNKVEKCLKNFIDFFVCLKISKKKYS